MPGESDKPTHSSDAQIRACAEILFSPKETPCRKSPCRKRRKLRVLCHSFFIVFGVVRSRLEARGDGLAFGLVQGDESGGCPGAEPLSFVTPILIYLEIGNRAVTPYYSYRRLLVNCFIIYKLLSAGNIPPQSVQVES